MRSSQNKKASRWNPMRLFKSSPAVDVIDQLLSEITALLENHAHSNKELTSVSIDHK